MNHKFNRKSATRLTAVSSPLFTDNHGHFSLNVPKSRRSCSSTRPQAYIYHWSGFRIPVNAEKPEWWWRTLSCIPYLLALQLSTTGNYLVPLINKFELDRNVLFYIPGALTRLPFWFHILYGFLATEAVVKNRDFFPLSFRFHVMTGVLLETALQIVSQASNFMPLIHFQGTLGTYYWAALSMTYIIITMYCIRCALLGKFSNIPVISQSAFLHSLFNLGRFQRPF
ncbi:unnamed protein product [Trifolium pratense]|uniref:Uncharacterized protein n=1 Tax=Trifolium pratense TaxID=57577 RepID=A0ACB0KUY3_TRIPR|nr:unnamed protein product [Trifolium pratense]